MPRLSIDIDAGQHQQLKALASLNGQSIKDYVLDRALIDMPPASEMSDAEALQALKQLLSPRIDQALAGEVSSRNMNDIIAEAKRRKSEV